MSLAFLEQYFREAVEVANKLDLTTINRMVDRLVRLREEGGRLFLCGVGGSAACGGGATPDGGAA